MVNIFATISMNGNVLQNVNRIDDNAGSQINFFSEVNHQGLDIENVDDIHCNDLFAVGTDIVVHDDFDMNGNDIDNVETIQAGAGDGNLHLIGDFDAVTIGNVLVANSPDDLFVEDDCHVNGTLSKTSGSFKIDHPLDPENKFLYHSFVESPEMRNIYYGQIETINGKAIIRMADWFHALNGVDKLEFNYQLTTIGKQANVWISKELENFEFEISSDLDVKVSWQVSAIRHDKFAEENRIQVETNKNLEVEEKAPSIKSQSDNYLYDDDLGKPYKRKHHNMIMEQKPTRLEIKILREEILVDKNNIKTKSSEINNLNNNYNVYIENKDESKINDTLTEIKTLRNERKEIAISIKEKAELIKNKVNIILEIQKSHKIIGYKY